MNGFRGQMNDLPVDIQDSVKDIILKEDVKVDHEFENALMRLCLDDFDNRCNEGKAGLNDIRLCHKQVLECQKLNCEGGVQADGTLTNDELLKEDVEVDHDFERALMELHLSDTDGNFEDSQAFPNNRCTRDKETKQVSDVPDIAKLKVNCNVEAMNTSAMTQSGLLLSSEIEPCKSKEIISLNTNNTAEESFDGEFGAALLDALSSNPNIFP